MKKYATLIIGILLIWNAILTIQYIGVKDLLDAMEITGEVKTIRTVVTEFDTNVTKVVKDNIKSVVRITYYQGESTAVSTGAIISSESGEVYIITNHHSLNGINRVSVTFNSGEEVDAVVVGSDSLNDLSLVKVTVDFRAEPFSVGDSSLVSIGTNALTIGAPLGFEFTGSASLGIITAVNRVIEADLNNDGEADWESLVFQTDASINKNNTGGPLINLAGELIGITTMKFDDKMVGGGVVIPINEVMLIVDQLKVNAKVTRPLLGISAIDIDPLTQAQKSNYGVQLDLDNGIMITVVYKGSSASKAGLKAADVITQIDGVAVNTMNQFRKLIYGKKSGDQIEIMIVRGTGTSTLTATLE